MKGYSIKAFSLGAFSALFILSFVTLSWLGEKLSEPVRTTAGLFTIKRGASLREIAFSLQRQGVIENPILLLWYGEITGRDKTIQAGVYDISTSLRLKELLDLFENGSNVKKTVVLPEGLTAQDALNRLKAAGLSLDSSLFTSPPAGLKSQYRFFSDAPIGASLEGFLFPDTYIFDPAAGSERVTRALLDNFQNKFNPRWYEAIQKQGHSVYDTVIIASILEKEVRTGQEKKITAGILWKRLSVGMPMQLDSTLNYVTGKNTPAVSNEDIALDSPYNTYKYQGLPPGPISNPGLESIEAAIYPAPSEYWFYLSRQDSGQTIFSKTYKDQMRAKAKYLK